MPPLTIRAAADRLGVSYSTFKRWVLNGRVRTTRTDGGHHRVPESELERLVARQQPANKRQQETSGDTTVGELSARNRLRGFVEEVRVDGLLAQVRLRVGDQRLTAVITADAIAALKLRRGDDALAIIKSTEVMIAREVDESNRPSKRRRARG